MKSEHRKYKKADAAGFADCIIERKSGFLRFFGIFFADKVFLRMNKSIFGENVSGCTMTGLLLEL